MDAFVGTVAVEIGEICVMAVEMGDVAGEISFLHPEQINKRKVIKRGKVSFLYRGTGEKDMSVYNDRFIYISVKSVQRIITFARTAMRNIGLIVNPIAGMGGAVGLKGTDGEMHQRAIELGALPVTPVRTKDLLNQLVPNREVHFFAAPGKMGEFYIENMGFNYSVVGDIRTEKTSSADTREICRKMVDKGADLIIFVGGDGTARDIFDAIGLSIPVVAVPSGVKIFSGVFAVNASAAASLVEAFLVGSPISEEEVLDIDEEAYRENRLEAHLYGYLKVPKKADFIQHSKSVSPQGGDESEQKLEVAEWVTERMEPGVLYFLGPGTTVAAIAEALGLNKTLLGIDAIINREKIAEDINEKDILKLMIEHPLRKIIVTPIGGNGFIFGRGNKQFTPLVIRQVGIENIIIVSTINKITSLDCLRVDTGESELDHSLSGFREVIVGDHLSRMVKVK